MKGQIMEKKFYLQTWFIVLLIALWPIAIVFLPLIISPIVGIILLILQHKSNAKDIIFLNQQTTSIENLKQRLSSIGAERYEEVTIKVEVANQELDYLGQQISSKSNMVQQLIAEIARLSTQVDTYEKQINTQQRKLIRMKELYKAVEYALENESLLLNLDSITYDELCPSVILKLNCMDIKDLRKAFRDNDKQIKSLLELYSSRYTTKGNIAIYNLMVIALMAELQNILIELKYEKLDDAVKAVKEITRKYLDIAGKGNQTIIGTLTRFIGEIEYLFINAVKIEYNYYVKKEQARQEQLAIREQMRQETEERKALELERKKIEAEEQKYHNELAKIQDQLSHAESDEESEKLNTRILQLESMLSDVIVKKEEIINLQNGKAGTVYIISNLGSFGEDVFKIGMTRRQEPQDRINELGDASVPFRFDVHSFIFSEDAVSLESRVHALLENRRMNKVNIRKEFFRVSLDELEQIVNDLEPTAAFNKTMIATEFRQSLSADQGYSSDYVLGDEENDE